MLSESYPHLQQLIGIGLIFTGCSCLGYMLSKLHVWLLSKQSQENTIATAILELLPQTQCAQCGHPGCAPYAEAIAAGEAHNKCPPGGQPLIDTLSNMLNRESLTLADNLTPAPDMIAVIREEDCIGCAKCGPVCPTDAIVGAAQMMHTIILLDCTGCELCLPPCPVDCIDLIPRASI